MAASSTWRATWAAAPPFPSIFPSSRSRRRHSARNIRNTRRQACGTFPIGRATSATRLGESIQTPLEGIMDQISQRLEAELDHTRNRIRHSIDGAMVEETSVAVADACAPTDGADAFCRNADRELSFATRSLLVERARKLSQALERLRDGAYGVCEECDGPIAPARLQAMPEVTTCVRCQDRLERRHRVHAKAVAHHRESLEEVC